MPALLPFIGVSRFNYTVDLNSIVIVIQLLHTFFCMKKAAPTKAPTAIGIIRVVGMNSIIIKIVAKGLRKTVAVAAVITDTIPTIGSMTGIM